ncbi:MAG: hypothetical protein AAFR23_05075 [Pseudomonadota bacterium]
MRQTLTYDLIEQTLGEETTREIINLILAAPGATTSGRTDNERDQAMLDLITVLQARILQRQGIPADAALERGQLLCDLMDEMRAIEDDRYQRELVLH